MSILFQCLTGRSQLSSRKLQFCKRSELYYQLYISYIWLLSEHIFSIKCPNRILNQEVNLTSMTSLNSLWDKTSSSDMKGSERWQFELDSECHYYELHVRLNKLKSSPKNSSFLRMDMAGLYHWRADEEGERNSRKVSSSNIFNSKENVKIILMFPDLQDSWSVQQVCDELWQNLAAEGQSEQESASSLSRDQLLASFGLLHSQGQSRQPATQEVQ